MIGYNSVMVRLLILTLPLAAALAAQDAPRKPYTILQETCGSCHGLNRIDTSKNRAEWKDTVDRMIYSGADVKPEEVNGLVGYLVRFYGESVEVNKFTAKQLEEELDLSKDEAEAIVKARTDNGNFKEFTDLQKVKGLDLKKLEPVKDRFRF